MAAISEDKKMEIKENLFSNKDLEELCREINNKKPKVRGILILLPSSLANRITLLCSRNAPYIPAN